MREHIIGGYIDNMVIDAAEEIFQNNVDYFNIDAGKYHELKDKFMNKVIYNECAKDWKKMADLHGEFICENICKYEEIADKRNKILIPYFKFISLVTGIMRFSKDNRLLIE